MALHVPDRDARRSTCRASPRSGSAANRIDAGDMQVGALIAFLSYLIQILMAVMMATFVAVLAPPRRRCAPNASRRCSTRRVVGRRARRTRSPSSTRRASLELRDVGFQYPGAEHPVLCDISFTVRAGADDRDHRQHRLRARRRCSTWCRGCSTRPAGTVLVDGVDVRDIDPELAVEPHRPRAAEAVPVLGHRRQQPALRAIPTPPTTSCGRPSRSPRRATSCAAMPGRLDAPIAQGGTNVSGGQRQRLAIARALVRRPGIYLFDDSFSALDLATDARLRAALAPVIADAATVIVAQRVSTIMQRRPDPRARGRPAGRARHAPRAARDVPDLRRDRGVAAHGGGGGMSATAVTHGVRAATDGARRPTTAEEDRGVRRRRPSAAVGSAADGAPSACRSSGRRTSRTRSGACCARLAARRARRRRACSCSRSSASRCWCIGPRILGHATNIIVDGRQSGRRASTSRELHTHRCCSCSCIYVASAVLSYLQAYVLAGVVQRTMSGCAPTSRTSSTACRLRYVDRQPRGDLLSRVTNDIDNLAQSLQQTLSQMLTSIAHDHRRADHDDHDLAAAGARRARSPSRSRCSR